MAIALENNPDLIAARDRAEASDIDIRVAGAGRLPRVSVITGYTYQNFLGTLGGADGLAVPQASDGLQAGLQLSLPLFQGGRPAAQERQAQARASVAQEQVVEAERSIIAQARSAFASWRAALAIIEASEAAVSAAALGLEGVRAENTVGNRTVLDILDAERELLNARVQLVTAQRNAYVAGFSLLAAMGRAEARDLDLASGGPLYDPAVNYERSAGPLVRLGARSQPGRRRRPAPPTFRPPTPPSGRSARWTTARTKCARLATCAKAGYKGCRTAARAEVNVMHQPGEPSVEVILDSIKRVIARENRAIIGRNGRGGPVEFTPEYEPEFRRGSRRAAGGRSRR